MGIRSTGGVGFATALDGCVYSAPLFAWGHPGVVPGIIYCHGAGDSSVSPCYPSILPGQYKVYNALRESFCVGGGNFGGDNWGNSTAVTMLGDMKTYIQSQHAKAGKVALVGVSMGVITALNYALAHPTLVSCVAGIIPALNVQDFKANNWNGLAASVDAAYGGTYVDGTVGSTSNPHDYQASFPTSIPVHFWYSTADLVALPTWVTQFVAACSSAQATTITPALNHGDASVGNVPANDVVSFIRAHA